MNDTRLAQELAAVLAADAEFAALFTAAPATEGEAAAVNIYGAQSGFIVTARPSVIAAGEYEPFGVRRKGNLTLEVRSRIGQAGNHPALFDALWNKLLGAPGADTAETLANRTAAKAAIKSALAAAGNVAVMDYGPASDAILADAEGDDLRTILTLRVVWQHLAL